MRLAQSFECLSLRTYIRWEGSGGRTDIPIDKPMLNILTKIIIQLPSARIFINRITNVTRIIEQN